MNIEISSQSKPAMTPWWEMSRQAQRSAVFAAAVLSLIVQIACAGGNSSSEDPSASTSQEPGTLIEDLRQAIERDHARLEELITRPQAEGATPLHDDPELRLIAARLTERVRRLERLAAAARDSR